MPKADRLLPVPDPLIVDAIPAPEGYILGALSLLGALNEQCNTLRENAARLNEENIALRKQIAELERKYSLSLELLGTHVNTKLMSELTAARNATLRARVAELERQVTEARAAVQFVPLEYPAPTFVEYLAALEADKRRLRKLREPIATIRAQYRRSLDAHVSFQPWFIEVCEQVEVAMREGE